MLWQCLDGAQRIAALPPLAVRAIKAASDVASDASRGANF